MRKVLPNGAVYTTTFDDNGRIEAEIGPLGATTRYDYDAKGNLARRTWPNGGSQVFAYDEDHQPTAILDPDGAEWKFRYERGAMVEVTDPFGSTTKYRRNAYNDIVGVVMPNGNELTLRTDDTWTEEVVFDCYGPVMAQRLDLRLNPIEVSGANQQLTRFAYDSVGRVIEQLLPDGTRRELRYDSQGAIVGSVDGRGGTRTARVSPFGDILEHTDPLGRAQHYEWDAEGRIVSIRNPKGEIASFQYDAVGNCIATEHFDGSLERVEYDLAGCSVRIHRPDGTVLEHDRDVVGNLTRVRSGGQELQVFEYNPVGDIIEARSPDGIVHIEYAPGGRIVGEEQGGVRIDYEYGTTGELVCRTMGGSKAGALSFEYDLRGRLCWLRSESGAEQRYRYDASDLPIERRMGPVLERREFDVVGRLRQQTISGLCARTYTYDAEGALVSLVDSMRGRRTYEYDLADQLLRSVETPGDKSSGRAAAELSWGQNGVQGLGHRYEFDSNGNLRARDDQAMFYEPGDRLDRFEARSFDRDPNGCLVESCEQGATTRYHWDPLGQLSKVVHPDGAETRFGYDALGRRVYKEHAGVTTRYWWSGDDLVSERVGEQLTEYAMFGCWPLAIWEDGAVRHVVTSHHGVPQELLDEVGRVVWSGEFDDWGRLVREKGPARCRLRLLGQLADVETGLHYNRYRYYSPDSGQYISPDPIGVWGGLNRFRYAPNAVTWIDTLGLRCGRDDCASALSAKLRSGEVALPDSVLYRTRRTGPKGRPYGSPSNPHPPPLSVFNPRVYPMDAGDIKIGSTLHPTNAVQGGPVSRLSNAELVSFRQDDPISSQGLSGGGLSVTGGHHRLEEIQRRVEAGTLPPDTRVPILLHD